MKEKLEDYASKSLGDSTSYAVYTDKFDPSLLNPMPRSLGREDWNIKENFTGVDVWHCHESSFLTNKGLPVAGTLKFAYASSSEFMVESKSAKLYLNSFDMCKMGDTIKEATKNYEEQVKRDLEDLLKVEVKVKFHPHYSRTQNFTFGYIDLASSIENLEELEFTDYKAGKNHLVFQGTGESYTLSFKTNILRSRCRHTKQKDVGTAFITISTENGFVTPESLLRQIISLREQNEFHELLAEKLYSELMNINGVKDCMVMLLYSRRGSLDINPVRASKIELIPKVLLDVNTLGEKTQSQ